VNEHTSSRRNSPSRKIPEEVGSPPQKQIVSRSEAVRRLDRYQFFIGIALLASTAFGAYLLVTDKSLWLLAVSHAYGLLAICIIDVALAIVNILNVRKVFIPTLGWAVLTIALQIGDIATAPQYGMQLPYFASYLFGLWAYDALIVMQIIVIGIVLLGRRYQKIAIRKKKQLSYFDMGLKSSRRDFLQIGGTIGAFFAIAAALGIWTILSPQPQPPPSQGNSTQTATTTNNLPSGAVGNVRDLAVGVPQYFDYPSSGYTNMLLKKANGSVTALSILCTHVCCQCQFDNGSSELYCPCHGSIFDLNGNVLQGPAASKLPSVQLSIDQNGNIFPVKVVGSSPCVSG
jgi:Rieske Fe-S protein